MADLEFADDAAVQAWLTDNGYPKTGFNAASGEPATDDKQKTERPVPIIEAKTGTKRLMEGVEEKEVRTAKRLTKVAKADWNFPKVEAGPIKPVSR